MSSLDGGREEIRRIAAEEGGADAAAQLVDDVAAARRRVTGRASSPGGEVSVTVDHLGRVQRVDYFAAIGSVAPDRVASLTLQATGAARQRAAGAIAELTASAYGPEVGATVWEQLGVAMPRDEAAGRRTASGRAALPSATDGVRGGAR